MSSLSSLVKDRYLRIGDRGAAVVVLQASLQAAGYRIGTIVNEVPVFDGIFGDGTLLVVKRFQTQHGLLADGRVGGLTAALLDAPHDILVTTARPITVPIKGITLPHDDTASLTSFYGNPDSASFEMQLVGVTPPFRLTYDGKPWPHAIMLHKKCAPLFEEAFDKIWVAAGKDNTSPILKRVSRYSGGHVNRPVRGSSRKSCHAYACAVDFDAEDLPMGKRVPSSFMPIEVDNAFKSVGIFWGGDYVGRPDPMHYQAAHE